MTRRDHANPNSFVKNLRNTYARRMCCRIAAQPAALGATAIRSRSDCGRTRKSHAASGSPLWMCVWCTLSGRMRWFASMSWYRKGQTASRWRDIDMRWCRKFWKLHDPARDFHSLARARRHHGTLVTTTTCLHHQGRPKLTTANDSTGRSKTIWPFVSSYLLQPSRSPPQWPFWRRPTPSASHQTHDRHAVSRYPPLASCRMTYL